MSFIGNVLWIVLGGGILIFFWYLLGGLILCVTIVGIPFGVQLIKLSILGLMPFGVEVRDTKGASGCLAIVMNIIWIFLGGIELVVTHLVFALLCAITIIGIPFARQHLKLAAMALTPFGKTIA
ncbi:YccF domain-containing protein [bacterium]|nr:YccF domain-containing protein [bacterium]